MLFIPTITVKIILNYECLVTPPLTQYLLRNCFDESPRNKSQKQTELFSLRTAAACCAF